eukprot:2375582-Rhodomonas_salina.1
MPSPVLTKHLPLPACMATEDESFGFAECCTKYAGSKIKYKKLHFCDKVSLHGCLLQLLPQC